MTDKQLKGLARRLDRDSYRRKVDPNLQRLVNVSDRIVISLPLGLMVDGAMYRGAIAKPEQFASALDEAFVALVGADNWHGVMAEFQEKEVSARRNALDYLDEAYETSWNVEDLTDEDFDKYLESQPNRVLTLQGAEVFAGGAWNQIGVIAISLDHIGAWWPLEQQDNVTIDYDVETDDKEE